MPKIPVLNRQYNQTSGGISPDVAALPGRAIQGFGQAVSGVSDIYQMRKVAERNTKLLKIENMMNEDKRAFADMLRMDTNYDGLEERADKVLTGFQDRYSKEIQNDPKGMEALNRAYGQFSNELRNMAWERRNSLHITERNVELDKAIKNKLNDYALETDSTNRKAITDTTFALIDAGVADGTLDLSNAQKIKDDFIEKAEKNRIESMIMTDPVAAEKALNNGEFNLPPDETTKYKAKVKDISTAYQVDDVVTKATVGINADDSDELFDIEKYYENVKEITDNPEVRRQSFLELERMKRVKDQSLAEKYNYHAGIISDAFMADENFTVNDAKKMPEFAMLTKPQQTKIIKNIESSILARKREQRAIEAAERVEKRNEEAIAKQEQDTAYLELRSDPERVYEMTDDELKAQALIIGKRNYESLDKYRKSLRKSKSIVTLKDELITKTLSQANITDDEEQLAYYNAIDEYVGDETDPVIVKRKVAEAMKHAAMTKKNRPFFSPKVEIKDNFLGVNKDGENVYQLPNGKRQIGD